MRLYPILALSVLGLADCAGGYSAARLDGATAIAQPEAVVDDAGTVIRTKVPPELLAEIVAKAAALPANRKTRLAALAVVTDAAPPAAASGAGPSAAGFDADTVDAAMDALGAIIRAARSAPAAAPTGAVPFVSYTIRLDRGTTVRISQPWRPGDQIIGPRERAAIRVVHGAREVVPEGAMLPAAAAR